MKDKKSGKMIWTPGHILRELDNIMSEKNLNKRSDAWNEARRNMIVGKHVTKLVEPVWEKPKVIRKEKKPKFRGLFGEKWD